MDSQGGPEREPALRLRITHIMSSMAAPLPSLHSQYIPSNLPTAVPLGVIPQRLPVLRVFGTTTSRQKICANVHLCFPYFFVPFPMDSTDPLRPDRVIRLCQRFAVSLNHAIALALRQSPTGPSAAAKYAGGTDPKHLHVISVMLVKGTPFYGYHLGHSYFLKVSLVNPARLRVAVEQLHKPVVLGREWQPHEAHLSHVLQFMCDFDLYGCGWLDMAGGIFRDPLPEGAVVDSYGDEITEASAPLEMRYPTNMSPSKDTFTTLEIDVMPYHIINRNRLKARALHHDFIELLHQPLHPEEKLVPAMHELWEDERRRRAARGLGTDEKQMLPVSGGGRGRSMEELGYKVDGRDVDNRGGDWKISEELWELLEQRMTSERHRKGKLTFDRFARDLKSGPNGEKRKYDKWIMTVFDAVSAHWQLKAPRGTQKRSSVKLSSGGEPTTSPLPSSPSLLEDEEQNPFDLLATQASQQEQVQVEVNADAVKASVDEDEEEDDPERRQHRQAAEFHAQEGARIRATQHVKAEEYEDDDLDELFREIIKGEEGTPQRTRLSTPTSRGSTYIGTASTATRREKRHRLLTEQAGFGDLSTIMDMSFALSSPGANPYADPRTPTKPKDGTASQTPASLVRNIFARPRQSPLNTPSKRQLISPSAVVLPNSKRSFKWTPSPQDREGIKEDREPSPSPRIPEDTKLLEIKVCSAGTTASTPAPPNAQPSPFLSLSNSRSLSPTFKNPTPATTATPALRPKKRVRLSSPSQGAPLSNSQRSVVTAASSATGVSSGQKLSSTAWQFRDVPPTCRRVVGSMVEYGLDPVEYPEPFYSNSVDVPTRVQRFAGRAFKVKGNDASQLQDFESERQSSQQPWLRTKRFAPNRARYGWEFIEPPPSLKSVTAYCDKEDAEAAAAAAATSQLVNPTQKNKFGFKFSQRKTRREQQNMSVLLLEVFAPSRHQLLPDPEHDEIAAVFFCFQNEDVSLPDTTRHAGYHGGYVVVESPQTANDRARLDEIPCHYVESELDLINWVIDAVKDWDPDVLAGWELHNSSWGYLSARAREAFGTCFTDDISRLKTSGAATGKDAYSEHHTSSFKVTGRHVINIWRIIRSEVTLTSYSFENCVFHVLHQRVPHYSAASLTALWKSVIPAHTVQVLHTFFQRVVTYAELIDASEVISKNAEFGRVFGVDFDAVIFRGSQFKVESFMFRIAKPESFVMVTPSKQQVGLQNAPFAVPLIAEPESKYYSHPVIVLDFQSLYPSVMIAYNICYSTCLGRVEKFKGTDKLGFTELRIGEGLLELLKDYLTVTPNGMIFVKPAVRKSLLAKMLGEILDTRVMVKHAMKDADKGLKSMLNARQLALKLMANVTYGYTSATYSGRMPCIEIADSIVQTGRETLEKAQELIHSREEWGATVVYGDTDSLFVSLPGRTKDDAFRIGYEIAEAVTSLNPKPVKLKFEKVYMGCVLMAKKRYVGFKYESPEETEPVFDAKGIETIRRDGFPAQAKMEEVCLKMLFRTNDLSQIKAFCREEWAKILQGRASIQDFIVAKEVRLGTYSETGVPPPGAAVAYRRILKDPRDEPQYAERVPYVISNAEGRRLIDRARTPQEMLASRSLSIDAEYYIRNLLIPPLARIFNLVGADVEAWFDTMPRTKRARTYGSGRVKIDAHFRSSHCVVCGVESNAQLCPDCLAAPDVTAYSLLSDERRVQRRVRDLQTLCADCAGTPCAEKILCDSIDCPVTYARTAAERDAADAASARTLLKELEW